MKNDLDKALSVALEILIKRFGLALFDRVQRRIKTRFKADNPAASIRLALVEVAEAEVGTLEVGMNSGDRIREYQAATWYDGTGWAYCAAFVCWCLARVAENQPVGFKLPQTPRAYEFEFWGAQQGIATEILPDGEMPAIGDIVIYNWSHIGICNRRDGSLFYCVEANTRDPATGQEGVFIRKRKKSNIKAIVRINA